MYFYFKKVNLYDWPALSNIPSISFLFDNKDELVSRVLETYNTSNFGLSATYINNLAHDKVLTKVFELGVELLVNSSLIADGAMTPFERLKERTAREVGLDLDVKLKQQRWVKGVVSLFLSKVFSLWVVQHTKNGGIHDHCYELLSLIRNRFNSNKIIYKIVNFYPMRS